MISFFSAGIIDPGYNSLQEERPGSPIPATTQAAKDVCLADGRDVSGSA
jgi:hypothetical protein